MPSDSTETAAATALPPQVVALATEPVEKLYRELEARVREIRPTEDLAALEKAYRFAAERHRDQKRVSGEPYMIHPLLVTRQLAEMNMDLVCLQDRKSTR